MAYIVNFIGYMYLFVEEPWVPCLHLLKVNFADSHS